MENKKIVIPNKKYIGSPDSDINVKLTLDNKVKNTIEGSYSYTISSNEQFTIERQASNLFRPYLKVSGMYYSNGLNSPLINNYEKEYNTNFFINRQNTRNENDGRNFYATTLPNQSFISLSSPSIIPYPSLTITPTIGSYNTTTSTYTAGDVTTYIFKVGINIGLRNIDTSNRVFGVKVNFIKNHSTTPETVFSQQVYSGNINAASTIGLNRVLTTTAITLNLGDTISVEIEDTTTNSSFLNYRTVFSQTLPNFFEGETQDVDSFTNALTNIDFIYDTVKTVTNINNNDVDFRSRSVIFSLTAPYDDIIVTNISPLTDIDTEKMVELIDYWYLPTDIKRDGSYSTEIYTNLPGNPIIVSATTGWINIGTFLTGTTQTDFSNSNNLRTNLFTFRGNMNIKIPKHKTYSFFVTVKNGDDINGQQLLKTSYGYNSIAGFMGLPESMAIDDIDSIKDYHQYCWLNIWPDSYELSGGTTTPVFSLLSSNIGFRDYYGWSNNNVSTTSGNPYIFEYGSIITGDTVEWAFRGVVNYKLVQREPYFYRTQKLLSYNDFFDSIVPPKNRLEYISDNEQNWDLYTMYSYEKDSNFNLYIKESGLTHTFRIGDGVPAKFNNNLTLFEISSSTNTVFNSYFNHNLSIGDFVNVTQISGTSKINLGVFPVVSVNTNDNGQFDKVFTIKLTGFTGDYIQFRRFLNPSDSGSLSEYYVRKYKIIESGGDYSISTPLSKNLFNNDCFYLTNKSEIDVSNLVDENNLPVTTLSFFFKKKDFFTTKTYQISKLKNNFYDEYYSARNGFISKEILVNETNFFITGTTTHDTTKYWLGLMASGLTNTYRDGSVTPDNVRLDDDVFVFKCNENLKLGEHINFLEYNAGFNGLSSLTQSVVYRLGDDFGYNKNKYFSLFNQYTKKPISGNNILDILGVKPTLNNVNGSKIAGSLLYPNSSIVLINNQISSFPIGSTIFFATGSTDTLTSSKIINYEFGGLYAVIDSSSYSGVSLENSIPLHTLQYYGDTYNIKASDLEFEHNVVYYLDENETIFSLPQNLMINDVVYGDVTEFNLREFNTYSLQTPNYMFKLKDVYGITGSTIFSAQTSTYGKTDLLFPVRIKYFTDNIFSSPNIEDKVDWAVYNDNLNVWQWRDLVPNGNIDENGNGADFPFLNGRHYLYSDIIIPIRSKHWNPIFGNKRSLAHNPDYNFSNRKGNLQQTLNNIEIC